LSNFVVDPYFFVAGECNYTLSETHNGSDFGISTTTAQYPSALGVKILSGSPLIGKDLLTVTWYARMSNITSDKNTFTYLWDGDGSPDTPSGYRAVSNAISTSSIGTSITEITYTFPTPAKPQANDMLTLQLNEVASTGTIGFSMDASNYVDTVVAVEYRDGYNVRSDGCQFKATYTC